MNLTDIRFSVADALESGLPLAIAFLGVWLVFRIQKDFDLTVDASLTLGASTTAVWVVNGGNPWIALLIASASGAAAGMLTYGVLRALRLGLVLASIIVSVGLFSVNLRVLGRPNVSLLGNDTIIDNWAALFGGGTSTQGSNITLFAILVGATFALVGLFLLTETGLGLRASGANDVMARSQGVSPSAMLLLALVLGNALTGLAGGIIAQQQGFADVSMGLGTIIFGVTAVLLGETVLRGRGPVRGVIAVLIGALLYRFVLALAFRAGIPPQDFRGLTAAIVIFVLVVSRVIHHMGGRRRMSRVAEQEKPTPMDISEAIREARH